MKKLLMLLCLLSLVSSAVALPRPKLYLDCDSHKSPIPGVRIPSHLPLTEGKFGKALRIERRTVNSANPEDWVFLGAVKRNGDTVNFTEVGEIRLPAFHWKKYPGVNAVSLEYKSARPLELGVISGHKYTMLKQLPPSPEFPRVGVICSPEFDTATICVKGVAGSAVRRVMFDFGAGFFNNFIPYGKTHAVDIIEVKNIGLFPRNEGAISCWVKAPWLNPGFPGVSCNLFGVNAAKLKRRSQLALGLIGSQLTAKGERPKGYFHTSFTDVGGKGVKMYFYAGDFPKFDDNWHHVALVWRKSGNKGELRLYLDGKVYPGEAVLRDLSEIGRFTIGYDSGSYLNGELDDFALFDTALDTAAVAEIYRAGKPLGELIKSK